MLKNYNFTFAKLALGIGLVVLAIQFGFSLNTYSHMVVASLAFPYPLDYGEGPLLDQTLRLASGENIYRNRFSIPPYTISNYPPFFLLLQLPFPAIFGPAFWYGRLISILGQLLTAVFVGLTIYTLTHDRAASMIGGVMFLAFPYGQYWSVLNRVDSLALALSWAAMFVIVRWRDRGWAVPACSFLLVLAIYTRQSYALAAPFGSFIWLLSTGRWRKSIQLALLTGGTALLLFLVLNHLTQGGFFLNIVTANVNPFYWETVRNYREALTDHACWLLVLIGVFLLAERFTNHTRSWYLVLSYLFAATLSAMTVGKDGSSVNYLLELTSAFGFAAGSALAWMGRRTWIRALAIAILAVQVGMLNTWMEEDYAGMVLDRVKQEKEMAVLFREVSEAEGIVLADEYMGLIPLAGKRLYFQPFEYKMLAEGGLWDETAFLNEIVERKFDVILWFRPASWPAVESRWTERQREMVREHYARKGIYAFAWIQRPKE